MEMSTENLIQKYGVFSVEFWLINIVAKPRISWTEHSLLGLSYL